MIVVVGLPVGFDNLAVMNTMSQDGMDGIEIRAVAIRAELEGSNRGFVQSCNEFLRIAGCPLANLPAEN